MLGERVFSALHSKTSIEIMRILAAQPSSVVQILNELNKKGFKILCRESVYRVVEKLVSAGLVEKYYDSAQKRICYKVVKLRIEVDFCTGKIT
jgi:Fe2+ or Zn2+ uptake regulation protein